MGVPHSAWHPSRASGNLSTASAILGIIGLAFNPLLSIVGMLFGSIGQDRKTDRRFKEIKEKYHITYFWER